MQQNLLKRNSICNLQGSLSIWKSNVELCMYVESNATEEMTNEPFKEITQKLARAGIQTCLELDS